MSNNPNRDVWSGVVAEGQAVAPAITTPLASSPLTGTDTPENVVFVPPQQQGFASRLWSKTKKEPLIPIGLVATVGFLTMGLLSMSKTNNSARQQFMMRGRVAAQAFTLGAFTFGLFRGIDRS